jgi:segregation and condensation protein B
VIAYRQPSTKAEVDRVRGVDSGGSLQSLLAKRLIACVGRKRAPGRPMLYGTTEGFLQAFGLAALEELPELAGDLGSRVRQLRLEEAKEQPEPSEGEEAGEAAEPVEATAGAEEIVEAVEPDEEILLVEEAVEAVDLVEEAVEVEEEIVRNLEASDTQS